MEDKGHGVDHQECRGLVLYRAKATWRRAVYSGELRGMAGGRRWLCQVKSSARGGAWLPGEWIVEAGARGGRGERRQGRVEPCSHKRTLPCWGWGCTWSGSNQAQGQVSSMLGIGVLSSPMQCSGGASAHRFTHKQYTAKHAGTVLRAASCASCLCVVPPT